MEAGVSRPQGPNMREGGADQRIKWGSIQRVPRAFEFADSIWRPRVSGVVVLRNISKCYDKAKCHERIGELANHWYRLKKSCKPFQKGTNSDKRSRDQEEHWKVESLMLCTNFV